MAASIEDLERLYRERFHVFRDGLASVGGTRDAARAGRAGGVRARPARPAQVPRRRAASRRGSGASPLNHALKARRDLRERWELDPERPAAEAPVGSDDDVRDALRALPPRRKLVVFLPALLRRPARTARSRGSAASPRGPSPRRSPQSHTELLSSARPKGDTDIDGLAGQFQQGERRSSVVFVCGGGPVGQRYQGRELEAVVS